MTEPWIEISGFACALFGGIVVGWKVRDLQAVQRDKKNLRYIMGLKDDRRVRDNFLKSKLGYIPDLPYCEDDER